MEYLNLQKANKEDYPAELLKRVYIESFLSLVSIALSISFFVVGLESVWKILIPVSVILFLDGLHKFYIVYFGKWTYIEGVCLTDDSRKKYIRFSDRRTIRIRANDEDGTLYDFSTSRSKLFDKGSIICIYTSSDDFFSSHGYTHIGAIYSIKVK